MYEMIRDKLARGEPIILDGGTGTDIQRRGVPMSSSTWCAEANMTHPDVVRAVHEDYIKAGADIIIANTFATSALLFNALGRDDELLEIDRAAVAIARQAARGHQVAVAGSMSTMRPVVAGSDRTAKQQEWPEQKARTLFKRKADNLARAGVDLIMMEMMRDRDYSIWASEAALATGLPVWIGISVERHGRKLTGFGREDQNFEDVAKAL
jgi:S-methylmethionine-dependent homocysteine/selenocysteine methylase